MSVTINCHDALVCCRLYALKEVSLDERSKHRTKDAVVSEAKYVWFITVHCRKMRKWVLYIQITASINKPYFGDGNTIVQLLMCITCWKMYFFRAVIISDHHYETSCRSSNCCSMITRSGQNVLEGLKRERTLFATDV